MSLSRLVQPDFSAGSQQDVAPLLTDPRGFLRGYNALLDNDGALYRRGGSTALSGSLEASLRFIWAGWLTRGRSVLLAGPEDFWTIDKAGNGVRLSGVGAGIEQSDGIFGGMGRFGGTGNFGGESAGMESVPVGRLTGVARGVAVNGMLFVPGGAIYAGSKTPGSYSGGTIRIKKGEKVARGIGTAFKAAASAGMLLKTKDGRYYPITSVPDDTTLLLDRAYLGDSFDSAPFVVSALGQATGTPYPISRIYAAIFNRLIACHGDSLVFSEPHLPHQFTTVISGATVENRTRIDEGVEIRGAAVLGHVLWVFTTGGAYTIRGMNLRIVDDLGNNQHVIDKTNPDLILWGNAGIANYRNGLIVPALDGVWQVSGDAAPLSISTGFNRTYRRHVELGHVPGLAWTDREHYFLPVLSADGAYFEDLLTCRLDRPLRVRGRVFFPWTQQRGAGAAVAGGVRVSPAVPGGSPRVYAAGMADGKLLDLASYFRPGEATKLDHDGSSHEWDLITRAYELGSHTPGRFRRLVPEYELKAGHNAGAGISAFVSLGIEAAQPEWDDIDWDDFLYGEDDELDWEQLGETSIFGGADGNFGGAGAFGGEGLAPPNVGRTPSISALFGGAGIFGGSMGTFGEGMLKVGTPLSPHNEFEWFGNTRGRYVLFRLRSSGSVAKLTLRTLLVWVAVAGGTRLQKVS